jgi:hypothetical protein
VKKKGMMRGLLKLGSRTSFLTGKKNGYRQGKSRREVPFFLDVKIPNACFGEMTKMKINKGYIAIGLIIAFTLMFELAAHADEFDQATTITFSEPIQIPGRLLPAGTYLFELADHGAEPNVVQVFSSDRTVLYGTCLTNATERREPINDTTVTLAEPESGGPDVLVKWFWPGREIGNEFVYSKQTEKELAQDRQQTMAGNQSPVSDSDSASVGN